MKFVIDRFEGEYAVCEAPSGKTFNVPCELFKNSHEGDVFDIQFNEAETQKRKSSARSRLNALFNKK